MGTKSKLSVPEGLNPGRVVGFSSLVGVVGIDSSASPLRGFGRNDNLCRSERGFGRNDNLCRSERGFGRNDNLCRSERGFGRNDNLCRSERGFGRNDGWCVTNGEAPSWRRRLNGLGAVGVGENIEY